MGQLDHDILEGTEGELSKSTELLAELQRLHAGNPAKEEDRLPGEEALALFIRAVRKGGPEESTAPDRFAALTQAVREFRDLLRSIDSQMTDLNFDVTGVRQQPVGLADAPSLKRAVMAAHKLMLAGEWSIEAAHLKKQHRKATLENWIRQIRGLRTNLSEQVNRLSTQLAPYLEGVKSSTETQRRELVERWLRQVRSALDSPAQLPRARRLALLATARKLTRDTGIEPSDQQQLVETARAIRASVARWWEFWL